MFHHSSQLQVACHLQSDASSCWSPKTIRDAAAHDFAISGQPGLWLDQATAHLYVFATRSFDTTAGVVCIDTTQPAGNLNPFCGFTALTAAGDAPSNSGVSNGALVGSRWYAFNYVNGASSTGGQNKLLCFNTATATACAGQPFTVAFGGGAVSASNPTFRVPPVTAIGGQVIVPVSTGSEQLACFDGATNSACGGSWPAPAPAGYSASYGAAFPTLNVGGATTGLCLPSPGIPCYSLAGASVVTPAGLAAVVSPGNPWNSTAFTLGPRIYVPNGAERHGAVLRLQHVRGVSQLPQITTGIELLVLREPRPSSRELRLGERGRRRSTDPELRCLYGRRLRPRADPRPRVEHRDPDADVHADELHLVASRGSAAWVVHERRGCVPRRQRCAHPGHRRPRCRRDGDREPDGPQPEHGDGPAAVSHHAHRCAG